MGLGDWGTGTEVGRPVGINVGIMVVVAGSCDEGPADGYDEVVSEDTLEPLRTLTQRRYKGQNQIILVGTRQLYNSNKDSVLGRATSMPGRR